jgi:hypothetical protein
MTRYHKAKTEYYCEVHCSECDHRVDDEKCSNCELELFEMADYQEGQEIYCHYQKDLHFCSKECVEEFKKKLAHQSRRK